MTFLKITTLIALLVYLLLCSCLYFFQRALLYFPVPDSGLPTNIRIGELTGWQVNPGQPRALMYFGGNAESIEGNIDNFAQLIPDATLYFIPYRGYGPNEGVPSESVLYADALMIYDHIKNHHATIDVLGRSLGSGVATYVASQRTVESVALVTPFDSVLNVAQQNFPWAPVGWLLQDRYESWKRVGALERVLVIAAENDQVIPRHHTDALVENIAKVDYVVVRGVGHNDISGHPEFSNSLSTFFAND